MKRAPKTASFLALPLLFALFSGALASSVSGFIGFIPTSGSSTQIETVGYSGASGFKDIRIRSVGIGTNADGTLGDLSASGSILNATIDGSLSSNAPILKLNFVSSTPINPTGTANGSQVMAGLAVAFTPHSSGRVLVIVSMTLYNTTAGDGAQAQIRYGTGTAPTNAAAATGTTAGNVVSATSSGANAFVGGVCSTVVSGLSVGTAYWFDLGENAIAGGTASLTAISFSIVEV